MGVVAVTDQTFRREVLQAGKPVFIDLWAPWCGPCKALAPVVERLSRAYAGRVKFVKVNVDENPAASEVFQVSSIPLVALVNGADVLDLAVGARSERELAAWIDAALARAAAPRTPAG